MEFPISEIVDESGQDGALALLDRSAHQPEGLQRRTAIQQRLELAAAKARIVDRKIELARQLAQLRDTMPNNRRLGAFAGRSISTTRTRHPR